MAAAAPEGAQGRDEAGDPNLPENDLEAKIVRVSSWLKKICGDRSIPLYEVNERTVDILHSLMERCEDRERDVSLLIEDMKHQEAEHEAATKEIQDILKDLGLSPTDLSRNAYGYLCSLSRSAMILETKDTSLTSLLCAISNLTSEKFETKQKNRELQRKLDVTKKKLASALMLKQQLLDDIERVEECQAKEYAKSDSRVNTLKYIRDKSLELRIRIRNAESELIDRGLDKSLTHDALVKSSEELAELQKKVMSLKKELRIYLDLPLSIPLAKVKVEEAKQELKALEDELSKELDKVAFEFM
ncbi:HAUS augmin-like complex subunit 1 [Myiozetetes cayanensis]|uniref:HAUS augmin-like complex subunit 1 n=1 Tax=Myiozetetes cayanensis TaxID=478635 RepID=UPI00215F6DC0|nr:HAUS augmin-like complex subunit 1 [Myiozetetes cayanensis]